MNITTEQRNWLIDTYAGVMCPGDDRDYMRDSLDNVSNYKLIALCDEDLDESWRDEFTDTFGVSVE